MGPHGVVHVVRHGARQGHQGGLQLRLDRLPLQRHVQPRVADRHRRCRQEALHHGHVPRIERLPLPGRDLQQAEELAAEEERRAQQAGGGRQAPAPVIGEQLPERIAAAVPGQPADARLQFQLRHQLGRYRQLAPHPGALGLRPDDLLRLDAECPRGGIPHEEGRRMVVVHELVQPVQDLVGEVPGPQLRDDLPPDAVQHPRQPHLLPALQLLGQHAAQPVERAPGALAEIPRPPRRAHHRHQPPVDLDAGDHHRPAGGRPLAEQKRRRPVQIVEPGAPAQHLQVALLADHPGALRAEPHHDRIGEMAEELARRPDALEIALHHLREQLRRGLPQVDHGIMGGSYSRRFKAEGRRIPWLGESLDAQGRPGRGRGQAPPLRFSSSWEPQSGMRNSPGLFPPIPRRLPHNLKR